MHAELHDNRVRIRDKTIISMIHGEGFGTMKKGKLDLSPVEALYLSETGRIDLTPEDLSFVFDERRFETIYPIYRDLRRKGFGIRVGREIMATGKRGKLRALPFRERDGVILGGLLRKIRRGRMIAMVVDDELDITSYEISLFKPQNYQLPLEGGEFRIAGSLALLPDLTSSISLYEANYLSEKGSARIVPAEGLNGIKENRDFLMRYRVYEHLRDHGYVPKSGFKYGSDFRVYNFKIDEIHAPYLVHCYRERRRLLWNEISRASRLAQNVKKKMLFATVGSKVNYIKFERIKL